MLLKRMQMIHPVAEGGRSVSVNDQRGEKSKEHLGHAAREAVATIARLGISFHYTRRGYSYVTTSSVELPLLEGSMETNMKPGLWVNGAFIIVCVTGRCAPPDAPSASDDVLSTASRAARFERRFYAKVASMVLAR